MRSSHVALALCASLLWACSRGQPVEVPGKEEAASEQAKHLSWAARWLLPVAEQAAEAGAGELESLAFGSGIPGDTVDAFAFVKDSECALIFARGSEQIEDLDLHVFGDDGEEFGADEATDEEPGLLVCPDRNVRLYVAARVAQGRGLVALGLQRTTRKDGARAAGAIGAKGAYLRGQESEAWPGLIEALGRHREDIGGKWTDRRRVALPVDSRVATTVSADVPAGRCLDVLALPGDEVSGLELLAQDPETGRLLGRAQSKGEQRSLVVCGHEETTLVQLTVRPRSGRGLAVLALSDSHDGGAQTQMLRGKEVLLLERPSESELEGLARTANGASLMELRVGELLTLEEEVHGCARFTASPSQPLMGFALRAWDEEGRLWGEQRSRWRSSLWLCGTARVRIEGEALRRAGTLRLVKENRSLRASAVLAQAPLAASRLLEELERQGGNPDALAPSNVRSLLLRQDRLSEETHALEPGQCIDSFLAGELDGFGLELRLLDLDTHQERALVRGARAVHASVCAEGRETLRLRVEATALRGQGQVLVANIIDSARP